MVLAAEQYACRLVVPSSQQHPPIRWARTRTTPTRRSPSSPARTSPASLKQLEKAVAAANAEHNRATRRPARPAARPRLQRSRRARSTSSTQASWPMRTSTQRTSSPTAPAGRRRAGGSTSLTLVEPARPGTSKGPDGTGSRQRPRPPVEGHFEDSPAGPARPAAICGPASAGRDPWHPGKTG